MVWGHDVYVKTGLSISISGVFAALTQDGEPIIRTVRGAGYALDIERLGSRG